VAEKKIGLKAIRGAQDDRRRGKPARVSGPVWLATGGAILLAVLVAWTLSGRALEKAKGELLAQQRAAVKTVGAEWSPLRDKLEAITVEASAAYAGDVVTPEVARWDFRTAPGLYLRLRVEDARSVEAIRKNAAVSLRDGFTACLLRHDGGRIQAIARGEEDAGTGARDQPWNLRQAYTATRVLGDPWASEVENAGDDLRLRVFEEQYARAKKDDIPFAIEIVKRAKVFLLVLDEDVPEAKDVGGDAGTTEALQQVPHPVRVHVVNLESGKLEARLRRTAAGEFMVAGERAITDPEVRAAMKRQINNCALAQEVGDALAKANATGSNGATATPAR
jgi:hypothetical protein